MIRFRAFHVSDDTRSLLLLYFLSAVQVHAIDVSYPKLCTLFLIPLAKYVSCFKYFANNEIPGCAAAIS